MPLVQKNGKSPDGNQSCRSLPALWARRRGRARALGGAVPLRRRGRSAGLARVERGQCCRPRPGAWRPAAPRPAAVQAGPERRPIEPALPCRNGPFLMDASRTTARASVAASSRASSSSSRRRSARATSTAPSRATGPRAPGARTAAVPAAPAGARRARRARASTADLPMRYPDLATAFGSDTAAAAPLERVREGGGRVAYCAPAQQRRPRLPTRTAMAAAAAPGCCGARRRRPELPASWG